MVTDEVHRKNEELDSIFVFLQASGDLLGYISRTLCSRSPCPCLLQLKENGYGWVIKTR